MAQSNSSLEILQKIYGYTKFRGEQETIIEQVNSGGNAFVLILLVVVSLFVIKSQR